MDEPISPLSSGLRSIIVKLVKEEYYTVSPDFSSLSRADLYEKYKAAMENSNSFFIICNYTNGLYEFVSENIKDFLGFDLRGYSPVDATKFITSIIHENHIKFMINLLLPVVLKYFKENATMLTGTDYRYTCCAKLKNVYDKYEWYLIDTAIVQVNESGFPVTTLITCTNIHHFKKDNCVYYNIVKKNQDGVYEVMLEGTENNELDQYKLTPREIQIINLISRGFTNKQIGEELSIAVHTVQTHRKNILRKTKCQGTAELTNFAFSRGLL
jgi:DNA-binding CsgD family transcriptional regulator